MIRVALYDSRYIFFKIVLILMIDYDFVVVSQSVQENIILVVKSLLSKTLKAIVSSNLCE
jgi:hypothetical protein